MRQLTYSTHRRVSLETLESRRRAGDRTKSRLSRFPRKHGGTCSGFGRETPARALGLGARLLVRVLPRQSGRYPDNIRATCSFLRCIGRLDVDSKFRDKFLRQFFAARRSRAVYSDRFDVPDHRHRARLGRSLVSRSDERVNRRMWRSHVFCAERVRRGDAHALHLPIGHNRQRLACFRAEEQHKADPLAAGSSGLLVLADSRRSDIPLDIVGVQSDSGRLETGDKAIHCLEDVPRMILKRPVDVAAWPVLSKAIPQILIGDVKTVNNVPHRDQFADFPVAEDEGQGTLLIESSIREFDFWIGITSTIYHAIVWAETTMRA